MDKKTFIAETLKEATVTYLSKMHIPLDKEDMDEFSSNIKSIAIALNDAWKEISDTDSK